MIELLGLLLAVAMSAGLIPGIAFTLQLIAKRRSAYGSWRRPS